MVIISARAGFEDMFPGDSHAWKMHAFLQVRAASRRHSPPLLLRTLPARTAADHANCAQVQVQNTLHVEAVTNLLSVGDSHIEMDAVSCRPPSTQLRARLALSTSHPSANVGALADLPVQVHLLGRSFAHALVKTVKLWERPTPYELQKQLEVRPGRTLLCNLALRLRPHRQTSPTADSHARSQVVADKLTDIYQSGTTLNIWLERENAQSPPPPQPPPLPPADDVASPAPGPQ